MKCQPAVFSLQFLTVSERSGKALIYKGFFIYQTSHTVFYTLTVSDEPQQIQGFQPLSDTPDTTYTSGGGYLEKIVSAALIRLSKHNYGCRRIVKASENL